MTNDSRSDNKSSKVNSGNFSEAYSKDYTEEQQKKLNSPNEIRLKANKQLEKSTSNTDCYWRVHNENWGKCCQYVWETLESNHPDIMQIRPHARWSHFGQKRQDIFQEKFPIEKHLDKSIELCIYSVLLDAGAPENWFYKDPLTDQRTHRSEGLAIASFDSFQKSFASTSISADSLSKLSLDELKNDFQISSNNQFPNFEKRFQLLQRLAQVLSEESEYFPQKILSNAFSNFYSESEINSESSSEICAVEIYHRVINSFANLWPQNTPQFKGDIWHYTSPSGREDYFPFHKLSQWLSYSLVEIFQRAGKKVRDIDSLTGLAEYRNGGLFIDLQILELKKEHEKEAYLPSDPQIIEWRALTIALLDRLWQDSLSKFSLSQSQWPIAMLLEGASWPSGRKIARELRGPKAPPPLKLILEGNVF